MPTAVRVIKLTQMEFLVVVGSLVILGATALGWCVYSMYQTTQCEYQQREALERIAGLETHVAVAEQRVVLLTEHQHERTNVEAAARQALSDELCRTRKALAIYVERERLALIAIGGGPVAGAPRNTK